MLKGDLSTTPLAPLLIDLARVSATGSLIIVSDDGEEAQLYLKAGLVYAVQVPGARPQLGSKLVSSGALAPEALADALEAQRTELQGWRLGELLVHLGYVEQTVVEAFVKEQVNDAMWDLMRWHNGRWRFRKNMKTREDVAPPMEVVDLLSVLRERGYEWETISSVVHGPSAVPTLSAGGVANPETVLDPEAWSMLCKIDGERSVADLARDCGYTLFEAGHVIVSLVHAGLVDIEEDVDVSGQTPYGASTLSAAWNDNTESAEGGRAWQDDSATMDPSDDAEGDALSRLARLVTEVASGHAAAEFDDPRAPTPNRTLAEPWTRGVEPDESFAVALAKVSSALIDVLGPADPATADPFDLPRDLRRPRKHSTPDAPPVDPEWERRAKLRSAAAAELAAAHALAEALRPSDAHHVALAEAEPESSDPDAVVGLDEDDQAAEIAAEEEAARVAAEEEAARVAAEEEVARLAAEEEAARLAAEEEAARVAAEEEAARLAAEEEATRIAAEEEAARLAAEEEAARLAAEEEAARVAAEEEAARLAAEEEAARLAAEEEAARVAAEEEAARLAAEEEAARLAAEEEAEAARLAADEFARLAAEDEAALIVAAEEAARLEAEADAAREAEVEDVEAEATKRAADAIELDEADLRAAEAAALLGQLSAEPLRPVVQPDDEDVPERDTSMDNDDDLYPMQRNEDMADTAALLRELSSLGTEDEDSDTSAGPPQSPRMPQRPANGSDKKQRKKIGLFGL
jgi:DNA segregation ATPase FtsK/SpoIIIE-like protein